MAGARMHRVYLGADAKVGDNGRTKDPLCLRPIWHPQHTLHRLLDPGRYTEDNPKFAALLAVTAAMGCPAPIIVRTNGVLGKGDEEYQALKAGKYTLQKDEPLCEIAAGNSRTKALRLVNERRAKNGSPPYRIPFTYRALDDSEMELVFSQENNVRQGNSLLQNLAIVEDRLKGGLDYGELVTEFGGIPEGELRRLYEPLRSVEHAVRVAFAAGEISLSRLKAIGKLPRTEQVAALKAVPAEPVQPVARRFSAKDRQVVREKLRALQERVAPDVRNELQEILERMGI